MSTDSGPDERATPAAQPSLAAIWRRGAAGCYDLLIVLALWFATGAAALALTRGDLDPTHAAFRFALALITLGYFALSWQRGGQTIGARAWRLRVEDLQGRALGARASWTRALVMCVGALPLGLGTWVASFDPARRSIQDRAAGSRVVSASR